MVAERDIFLGSSGVESGIDDGFGSKELELDLEGVEGLVNHVGLVGEDGE